MRASKLSLILLLAILVGCSMTRQPAQTPATASPQISQEATIIQHIIDLHLDPDNHTLGLIDTLSFDGALSTLELNRQLVVDAIHYQGKPVPFKRLNTGSFSDHTTTILLEQPLIDRKGRLVVKAHGEFFASTAEARFSHERVGKELSASISNEGIYLAYAAGWYPLVKHELTRYRVTTHTPAGIETITNGRQTGHSEQNGKLHITWQTDHLTDGLTLAGGAYYISETVTDGGVKILNYFLNDDPELSALYLRQSKHFVDMYSELLTPYPYDRFTTVENFFPTGYGMPGWTLLGSDVIRLPFIPYTSLGHEILHNWWGNSVFVDDSEGNWCEGITVYQADYLYKKQRSDADARQYRKNTLKEFTNYVGRQDDIPLSEFVERFNPVTRAVGYGKSMMFFHMIEERIGADAFIQALRTFIQEKQWQRASFSDMESVFARVSGQNLKSCFHQWLYQRGAPSLQIDQVQRTATGVTFQLQQDEPVFQLRVPVQYATAADTERVFVALNDVSTTVTLPGNGITSVIIDPDFNLLRFLDDREIEPSLSLVFADNNPQFIVPEINDTYTAMSGELVEGGHPRLSTTYQPDQGSVFFINPAELPEQLHSHFQLQDNQVTFGGGNWDLSESTVVLVERHPDNGASGIMYIFAHTDEDLIGLGRRLTHYGKYSYLVFQNGRNVKKGYWPVTDSPLMVQFP